MAKVKYTGESRRTFNWVSMGKAKSYSVSPGHTLNVPDAELPYLLSFGCFVAIIREPEAEAEEGMTIKTFEKHKISPLAKEIRISSKPIEVEEKPVVVDIPVVAIPVVEEPVVEKLVVEEPTVVEEVVEEKKVVKIDYTSKRKNELKKLCRDRGLSDKGNRDDLIASLVNSDNG